VKKAVARIRRATDIPVAVGFGIKTPAQAAQIARIADAAVVGSAIVSVVGEKQDMGRDAVVKAVTELCRSLADSVHRATDAKVKA
jgi:tryptophan synthase alpha chain